MLILLGNAKTMNLQAPLAQTLPEFESLSHQVMEKFPEAIKETGRMRAIELYNGMVFAQLASSQWNKAQQAFAQRHLRILSPLWGCVRPNDGISAYRLDFSKQSRWLYDLWLPVVNAIERDCDGVVLNLCSQEFSKLFEHHLSPSVTVVNVDVIEQKDGAIRRHSTSSKKGRGQVAQLVIEHQLDDWKTLIGRQTADFTIEAGEAPSSLVVLKK